MLVSNKDLEQVRIEDYRYSFKIVYQVIFELYVIIHNYTYLPILKKMSIYLFLYCIPTQVYKYIIHNIIYLPIKSSFQTYSVRQLEGSVGLMGKSSFSPQPRKGDVEDQEGVVGIIRYIPIQLCAYVPMDLIPSLRRISDGMQEFKSFPR